MYIHNGENCPICNRKLKVQDFGPEEQNYTCETNKCYDFYFYYGTYEVIIFDKKYEWVWNDDKLYVRGQMYKIQNRLKYWKENNRYLLELLMR